MKMGGGFPVKGYTPVWPARVMNLEVGRRGVMETWL